MATLKRKALSLETKVKILRAVDSGRKKKDVAEGFKIPPSTFSTILTSRKKIEETIANSTLKGDRKRDRPSHYPDVEEALFSWFKDVRARNLPVSGDLLQTKAISLACLLGHHDFKGSSGWLQRFKNRHEIVCHTLSGEGSAVNLDSCEKWLENFRPLLQEYEERDVYNVDETGVFYKLLPERSLAVKNETCHGGKKHKDRVTAVVAVNMDGSDKRQLTVIGKSARPRCLRGVRNLQVDYWSNKKAWMTTELFEDWLKAFDEDMEKQQRKVLLLLDNCSAHKVSCPLKAVRLMFLPPNTTSVLQPLDKGIIRSLKCSYRKRLVTQLVFDMSQRQPTAINMKTTLTMLYGSWNDVRQSTIRNCFVDAGFVLPSDEVRPEDPVEQLDETPWDRLTLPDITFEDFVSADDNLAVAPELTDQEIVDRVVLPGDNSGSDSESDSEDDVEEPQTSSADAADMMRKLRSYLEKLPTAKTTEVKKALSCMDTVENFILLNAVKTHQSKITSFFK